MPGTLTQYQTYDHRKRAIRQDCKQGRGTALDTDLQQYEYRISEARIEAHGWNVVCFPMYDTAEEAGVAGVAKCLEYFPHARVSLVADECALAAA